MKRLIAMSVLASTTMATGVAAAEPACPQPEAHAFDFWVGTWDIANFQRNPQKPDDPAFYPTGRAVVRVHPVAKGCAIVEHWQGDLAWGHVHGFSLRSWDPETKTWASVLNWPPPKKPQARFSALQGHFDHGRAVFTAERPNPKGEPVVVRYTFSDIGKDRYRWDSARSTDGGVSWAPSWIMYATRRPDGAKPVDPDSPGFSVPEHPLCTASEGRALDGLVGRWTGRTDGPLTPLPVTLEVRSILGGCALTEQWTIGDSAQFAVRAFDETTGQWVAWRLSSDDPKLRRLAGKPGAGPVFLGREGDERVRETWKAKGRKWVWTVEDAHGDGPFAKDVSAVLKPASGSGPSGGGAGAR